MIVCSTRPICLRQGGVQACVFAYITDADAGDWQSSIGIVLRRVGEYHDLEGALGVVPSPSVPRGS